MFISEDGVVKQGDFGLAAQLEHTLSVRATTCGTPVYAAPEVFDSTGVLKSDIWSLGMSVIEMAEGKHPFSGLSPFQVMNRVANTSPPTLSSSDWSDSMIDFVSKCLVKDVEKRASAEELMKVSSFLAL